MAVEAINVHPSVDDSDCVVTVGDPIDMPIDPESTGMVLLHLPDYGDFERHYQPTFRTYWEWVTELIDEAERVLEVGGRLIVVARHMERQGTYPLDLYPMLLNPLVESGFLVGPVYTWATEVATRRPGHQPSVETATTAASLAGQTHTSWRIVVAAKGLNARQPSLLERIDRDMPNISTVTDETMEFASRDVWLVSPAPTRQGDLPEQLVRVLINMFTFVDDVVVLPLAGSANVAAGCLREQRRVVIVEPDHDVFNCIVEDLSLKPVSTEETGHG